MSGRGRRSEKTFLIDFNRVEDGAGLTFSLSTAPSIRFLAFASPAELQGALQGVRGLATGCGATAENVLVVRVKLFASSGATGYEVVVRRTPA